MATYQDRVNLPEGIVRLSGQLTAQGTATVSDAITDVPMRGFFVRADFRLVSGAGATINPQLSRSATVFTVPDLVLQPLDPASPAVTASIAARTPYVLDASQLYIRPQCDAGADNVIEYEILIDARTF